MKFIWILFFVSSCLIVTLPLRVDEKIHYPQIQSFQVGNSTLHPRLTTVPTYHLIQASFGSLTGLTHVWFYRVVNVIFSVLAFVMVYKISRNSDKALLVAFLPVSFVFYSLIYTDILSLLFVLLTFYYRRHSLAGPFWGLLSILVRQNNILWVFFFALEVLVEEKCFQEFFKSNTEYGRQLLRKVRSCCMSVLKSHAGYIAVGSGFAAFVVINGGVSLGDASAHPVTLSTGNIFFGLALFGILFLPILLSRYASITKAHCLISIAGGVSVFLLFKNTHPYNIAWGHFFLRNAALIWADSSYIGKLALSLSVSVGIMCLFSIRSKETVWTVIAGSIFLSLSWLIEQRYYIIPFTLLLVRTQFTVKERGILLIWYITISSVLFIRVFWFRLFI